MSRKRCRSETKDENWGDLQIKKKKRSSPVNSTICVIFKPKSGKILQPSSFFFSFGDHPNFRLCFRICTLASTIQPATASHRPVFVGELIEMSINLVKSVMFHRSKKRDLRSKKRDKASKRGTVPPKAGRMVTLTNLHITTSKLEKSQLIVCDALVAAKKTTPLALQTVRIILCLPVSIYR